VSGGYRISVKYLCVVTPGGGVDAQKRFFCGVRGGEGKAGHDREVRKEEEGADQNS
jgi:hypothetical protein